MAPRIAVWLWIVVVSSGCSVEHFRAETVLKSDGRIERAIWQSSLNEEQQKLWPEVKVGEPGKRLDWDWGDALPRGGEAKPKAPNAKDGYVFARGEFASAEQIPEHYRKQEHEDGPTATLRRKVERDDLIFLTEHRWEESINDIVKLEDIPAARRELVDLLVPVAVETLKEVLEPDHDVTAAETLLRDEGARWLEELVALYLDLSLRSSTRWMVDKELKREAESRLEAINRRHGLKSIESDAIRRFGIAKIRQVIKRRDGKPLDDRLPEEILHWLLNEAEEQDDPENRFKQTVQSVIQTKHGSKEAFQKQVYSCVVRMVGLFHPLQTKQHFDDRLTMPGFVIETNGELLSENRVRWRFDAAQAFPFGYAMRCRSLEPNEVNQRIVFGNVLLKTHDQCEKFARLLKAKPEWRETLQKCVAEKSKRPLLDLRREVLDNNDVDERFKFNALALLLDL